MSSLAGTDGYTTIHIRPSKSTTSDMHNAGSEITRLLGS